MPATQLKDNNQIVSFDFHRQNRSSGSTVSSVMPDTSESHKTISLPITNLKSNVALSVAPQQKPHLVPAKQKRKSTRNFPFLVRANKCLQTILVALCGISICCYGLDVVVSHDVGKLQGQARRLSEQNSELSAKLLKSISYGELKDSVVGRFGLRVPDQVHIVKNLGASEVPSFRSHRHDLPLMSGY